MKEYIQLEWFEDFLAGENLSWDGRNIPTVTKSDICREFADEVIAYDESRREQGYIPTTKACLESVLAEMENEE